MFELGADLKLSVPRLLIPWVKKDLVALFMIPKTEIILGTSFQENIGLDKVGVITSPGKININNVNQTNVPNIFAIGDVSGPPWLAHRASSQAHVAVGHILGKKVRTLDNLLIPGCTYCEPQVSSLGLTEENAIKEGYQIKVGRSFFKSSGKALALGNTEGFIKCNLPIWVLNLGFIYFVNRL